MRTIFCYSCTWKVLCIHSTAKNAKNQVRSGMQYVFEGKNDWIGIRKSFFHFLQKCINFVSPTFYLTVNFSLANIEAVMCMKCMKEYINNLNSSNASDLFILFCTLILYYNNLKFIMEKKLYFYDLWDLYNNSKLNNKAVNAMKFVLILKNYDFIL